MLQGSIDKRNQQDLLSVHAQLFEHLQPRDHPRDRHEELGADDISQHDDLRFQRVRLCRG